MNSLTDEKYELQEQGFPRKTLLQLIRLIDVRDYHKHIKAKENFIEQGDTILPVMHKLINSEYRVIRKEAIKIVRGIAHKSSIPAAIRLLEDPESDIRWIAAEALIKIGRISIKPVLKALVLNGESYYLRQGAHHVLRALINKQDAKELKQLVKVIRHGSEIPETIPVKAVLALEKEEIV
jgi:HEAT repeat protein